MESYELNLMSGMIDILNRSLENPILSKEQYQERLEDLRQFEKDTDFMLVNSPNCPIDLPSIVKILKSQTTNVKECDNIEDVIEFANQKDMFVYTDIDGVDMSIIYTDGIIAKIEIDSALISIKKICNIPYKINKSGTYIVQGKVTVVESDKIKFLVHNVIKDDSINHKDDLNEAKSLWFDTVPNWLVASLESRNHQSVIDYIYECASDEELCCKGVVFRFNNKKDDGCVIYRHTSNNE